MKKIIFVLVMSCLGISVANGQSETQSFNVDGIKVIFKPTSKNVINIRIYFRGGVTNYPASKAGIEDITLDAAVRCGTAKYSINAFKDTLDRYGIAMYGKSTYDYGFIQVNCISKYFNQGWDLFSQAVMEPTFESKEFDIVKDNTIADNREHRSIPENQLEELMIQNAFKGTPYATNPRGTDESLASLTATDVANYYKTILNKNKIFIVVVGNTTKQDLYEKILGAFGNIPAHPYAPVDLQAPILKDNKLTTESSNLKINYIGAIMNAPEYTSIYYVPFRLGMTGIGGNLYQYLRSQHNLSYNPGSSTIPLKMPYAVMHAGTTEPQEAMLAMMQVLKKVQTDGLNDEWLQHIKNIYITSSYIHDQSASQITNNLGLAEILGDWHYADDLPKLVQMVTVDQVNMALNTYISGLKWTYLGTTDAIEGFKPPAY
jgi:predicted Zn-dependent peptidase